MKIITLKIQLTNSGEDMLVGGLRRALEEFDFPIVWERRPGILRSVERVTIACDDKFAAAIIARTCIVPGVMLDSVNSI